MNKKIDWGKDEDFISNYFDLKSSRKMSELYHCSKTSILRHAKEIGFDIKNLPREHQLLEKDKQDIIHSYGIFSATDLAKKYGVSNATINKIWRKQNLDTNIRFPKCDLTGQTFFRLKVISLTEHRDKNGNFLWLCQCECGNFKEISGTDLQNEKIKSCGCLSKECLKLGRVAQDLSSQKFGKLTVIKRAENKEMPSGSVVAWYCQCDCGNFVTVLGSNLKTGNTQSCGYCQENSHGNLKISQLLTNAKIPFKREYRFKDCKDKACLPFDFFVNDSYLIEFDGIQHFSENSFFNDGKIQQRDKIKSQWCKEKNIPLIRIPYTHLKELKLEDILLETSSFIEK